MTTQWIGQEDARGCGVACLAMLTGATYAEVKAVFGSYRNFEESGLESRVMDLYLAERGYAVARILHYRWGNEELAPWPPAPWAGVHLCHVQVKEDSPVFHFVILLGDGTVLDPLTSEPRSLTDYHSVSNIAAVIKSDFPYVRSVA